MTSRSKPIKSTLDEVMETCRFLKVHSKRTGETVEYRSTRVQINGCHLIWAKNKHVVYSVSTGLAGTREDVVDFLKSRDNVNDDSAKEVLEAFKNDKKMITSENFQDFNDYIQDKTRDRDALNDSKKVDLIPLDEIPDLLAKVRELRGQVSSDTRVSRNEIIKTYLTKIEETGKIYRLHGCSSEGHTADGKPLRLADRDSFAKNTIFLADSGPLSHFSIPAVCDATHKRYVVNFMTLYYGYTESLKHADAQAKARTFADELLAPFNKKAPPRKGGRGTSPAGSKKSKSPSPPKAQSRKASPDPKRDAPKKESEAAPAPAPPEASSRSASPQSASQRGRDTSPKGGPKDAPKDKSPSRGASPSPKPSGKKIAIGLSKRK